ncbi:Scr1 family TA system antitoxin-like transcriptional regulator [Actinomadura sp. LOL_011]|uniref:Scr1 family TA system antitoxin-like transcriptional regulator n=1 Tax=Actinomadura sp. LOL_011 TaxID=3345410 RepID=UPI003A802A99
MDVGDEFRHHEASDKVVGDAQFPELLGNEPPRLRGRPIGRCEDERRRLWRKSHNWHRKALYRKTRPLISLVMEESILYREVGSREVMRGQLEALIELSMQERVFLQIAKTASYEIAKLSEVMQTLNAQALNTAGSRALLREVIEQRWT